MLSVVTALKHIPRQKVIRTCLIALAVATPFFTYQQSRAANVSVTIDGNQVKQTIDGFGVNANSGSWDNGELRPALDSLINGGSTMFRVVVDDQDWEAVNDNADPNTFDWTYYNTIYSNAKFNELWNTIAYLNSKGITSNVIICPMGKGADWMGGFSINNSANVEDEYAEMIVSMAYYARNTMGLQFTLEPNNEPDIWSEGFNMDALRYASVMNKIAVRLDAVGLNNLKMLAPSAGVINYAVNSFTPQMWNYPALMNHVNNYSYHDYNGTTASADSVIKSSPYPNKHFYMTEFSQFVDGFAELDQGPTALMVWDGFDSVYAHPLDRGGSTSAPNDAGDGPALLAYDSATHTYSPRKEYYQFAQLFKYIPAGSVKIAATSNSAGVTTQAFMHNASGRFTLVGNNTNGSAQTLTISLSNVPNLPAALSYYQTNGTSNLSQGSDVTISGNTLTVTVPANTIFTLTGTGLTDQLAPTAPTNLSATGNVGQSALNWTVANDNVGVTRYNIYRSATAGFSASPLNLIGQSASNTYIDPGLAAGTYYYLVTAEDAAGNVSPASNEYTVQVQADTIVPVITLTSPSTGTTVGGAVQLTANASDNVSVTGVQFKVDGANIGNEVVNAPYATTWDTTTVSNTTHVLTATARDASGNITTATSTVMVNNVSGGVIFGVQTIQSAFDTNDAGSAEAFKYTATASGAAGAVKIYLSGSSQATSLKIGLYSNNGSHPGSLLASGNTTTLIAGAWNTIPLTTNPTLTSGTAYWIGILGSGGTVGFVDSPSGSCSENATGSNLASLPTTWTTAQSWATCNMSAYVTAVASNDTQAPTVAISSPVDGSTVSGSQMVTVNATDNTSIANVEWYLDGALVESKSASPYTFTWPTTAASNGVHTLTAKAYDAVGNIGTSSGLLITVANDVTPPTAPTSLTVTQPSLTQVQLEWTAATDTSGVTGYRIYRNGVMIGTATTTTFVDSSFTANATYTYTVSAFDAAGNESVQSMGTVITTAGDTTPPVVTVSAPIANATVSGTITLSANATDNAVVSGVQFKLDTANIGPEDTTNPYSVSWNSAAVANGSHTITATARDSAGNTSTHSIAITVNNTVPTSTAVTIDKQVTTHQSSKATSISAPALTTAQAGELLVAFIGSDGPAGSASQKFNTVTGGGLTWTLRKRTNTQAGTSEIWTAPATNIVTNAVVKATRSSGSYVGSITVVAFKGADLTNIGVVGGANGATGAPSATITASRSGSVVWGVGNDWDGASSRTVGSSQTLYDQYLASVGDTFWVQYSNNASTLGQSITINDSAPTNHRWNLALIEILPKP